MMMMHKGSLHEGLLAEGLLAILVVTLGGIQGEAAFLWEGSFHQKAYDTVDCTGPTLSRNLQYSISGDDGRRCQRHVSGDSGQTWYVLRVFDACNEDGQSWDQFSCTDDACTQCQPQGRVEGYRTPLWKEGACATYRWWPSNAQEFSINSFTMNFQGFSPLPASDIYAFPCDPGTTTEAEEGTTTEAGTTTEEGTSTEEGTTTEAATTTPTPDTSLPPGSCIELSEQVVRNMQRRGVEADPSC